MWWNCNKKLHFFNNLEKQKNTFFDSKYDLIFISETNLGYSALPIIKNFTIIADPDKKVCSHGGIVWYLKNHLARHIFQTCFRDSHISFRLAVIPKFVFFGVYIQPEGARYFDATMFSSLSSDIIDTTNKGLVPIIGGDFNARAGNINDWLLGGTSWSYNENIDKTTNKHGRTFFKDLCLTAGIMPINCLAFKSNIDNKYTYYSGQGKSQIDFALTNLAGRRFINSFKVINHNWHLSDHCPIHLDLSLKFDIDLSILILRAQDINRSNTVSNLKQLRSDYDYNLISNRLINSKHVLEHKILQNLKNDDIDGAIDILNTFLIDVHKNAKIVRSANDNESILPREISVVNLLFDIYLDKSSNDFSEEEVQHAFERYMIARKKLTIALINQNMNTWKKTLAQSNKKEFWKLVDWKGNYNTKKEFISPSVQEFECFYENLYDNNNPNEVNEINQLDTDVYIPALDDPITSNEISDAYKSMKKGGFDFNLPILGILTGTLSQILLILLNIMFFVRYPLSLATSLVSLIPKKGNLKLTKNYRGIQMLKLLACLFDRIIANRLKLWLSFHHDQTAFQTGKSTLIHIFTLRILIEIAKRKKVSLFVASFDVEKAFDIIPRLDLLKKLIKIGIGRCMLHALKQLYSFTYCIINFKGSFSEVIRMLRGIRQGASSSVLLFNYYMDDLFRFFWRKSVILQNIHCLIHADDTLVLSTNRENFVKKCNEVAIFMRINKLKLNVGKSAFLVINSQDPYDKVDFNIDGGIIRNKDKIFYLGVIISDCGSLKSDIKSYVDTKRSNVSIKFQNFCIVNQNAPLSCKLDVLNICVKSSLIYACETWGNNVYDAELIYRHGLKTALDIRNNVNNEIVYVETGMFPLECDIKSLLLKFWLFITDYVSNNPSAAIAKVLNICNDERIGFVKYYKTLLTTYDNPKNCKKSLQIYFQNLWKLKFTHEMVNDPDGRLGTYYLLNPSLKKFVPNPQLVLEFERKLITRFRTGSHSLQIEIGRYSGTPRENRKCPCNTGIQTMWHIFAECPITRYVLENYSINRHEDIFESEGVHTFLIQITKLLKIPIGRL